MEVYVKPLILQRTGQKTAQTIYRGCQKKCMYFKKEKNY